MITKLDDPSMYGYIKDTGHALRNAFAERAVFCDPFVELMTTHDFKRVYFVGSGTSYNASIYISTLMQRYARVEASAAFPTRFDERDVATSGAYRPDQVLVVGVSQSGTSVSTIDVMRRAHEAGFYALALTDVMDSPVTESVDSAIRLLTGKEEVHVETRGYQVSLFEGYLLAIAAGHALGTLDDAAYAQKLADAERLANDYDSFVAQADAWYDANVFELMAITRGYVCTYGINACTAEEAELKLNETYHKPVRGYELEEMIHGPHYALDENNYSFFVAPDGPGIERVPSFLKWYEDNKVTDHVFVITNGDHAGEFGEKSICFEQDVPDELTPLVMVIPLQIMACRNCINAKIDTRYRPANRTSFAHLN